MHKEDLIATANAGRILKKASLSVSMTTVSGTVSMVTSQSEVDGTDPTETLLKGLEGIVGLLHSLGLGDVALARVDKAIKHQAALEQSLMGNKIEGSLACTSVA